MMNKKEAKAAWKYIKKNNLVSHFYWDSITHMYDCYCKFCQTDNWRSWVGNPDIGYLYKVDGNNGHTYKGQSYAPLEGTDEDIIKNAVRCPVCDDLHDIIRESGYNPLPLLKKVREHLSLLIWRLLHELRKCKNRAR